MCGCGEHNLWPCNDVAWLAAAYDIAIDSALAAPQRLERGGSAPPC
jgi:hypothetical protein